MGQIRKRNQNRGLRKICDCPRARERSASWHFNFKPTIARGTEMAYGARPLSAITEDHIEV